MNARQASLQISFDCGRVALFIFTIVFLAIMMLTAPAEAQGNGATLNLGGLSSIGEPLGYIGFQVANRTSKTMEVCSFSNEEKCILIRPGGRLNVRVHAFSPMSMVWATVCTKFAEKERTVYGEFLDENQRSKKKGWACEGREVWNDGTVNGPEVHSETFGQQSGNSGCSSTQNGRSSQSYCYSQSQSGSQTNTRVIPRFNPIFAFSVEEDSPGVYHTEELSVLVPPPAY